MQKFHFGFYSKLLQKQVRNYQIQAKISRVSLYDSFKITKFKLCSIFQQMLIFCADDRISAGKALLHPYFAEFGFTPVSHSSTSDSVSESSASSMSEGGSSEANTSLSPVTHSTSFSSHETSGESFGDLSGLVENGN